MDKNEKATLVISRYWNHPQITVKVSDERIKVEMPLDEFLKALVTEVSHPSLILTRSSLEKELLGKLNTVLEKAKEATYSAT